MMILGWQSGSHEPTWLPEESLERVADVGYAYSLVPGIMNIMADTRISGTRHELAGAV